MNNSSRIVRKFERMFPNAKKPGDYSKSENIQQTDCYTALELLEQMMNENKEAWRVENEQVKKDKLTNDQNALTRAWQLIKERQANAV